MHNNQTPQDADQPIDRQPDTGLPSDYLEPEFPEIKGNDHESTSEPEPSSDSSLEPQVANTERQDVAKTDSLNRWLGTPKIRFTVLASCIGIVILGIGGAVFKGTFSTPKQEVAQGEVGVPKTKIKASAIVNSEQASHIREQQSKAGETAEKNGDTYLAPIVTVAENSNEELDTPTQPGIKQPDISNARTFKDPQGQVYTVEQAVQLLNSGAKIQGVTQGKGSIVDVNINASTPQSNATSNAPRPANSNIVDEKATFEPHVIKPYTPNNTNTVQSELMTEQNASLDQSVKDVDDWQGQYLTMRLKKANLVNQKTQLAFSEQVVELEKTVKNQSSNSSFSTRTYYQPEESKEQIAQSVISPSTQSESSVVVKPSIYAGESYRAILKNQVNSDNGNEIIATLQNGPLKGATLIGSIVKTNDNIQFNFTRLLRKGKSEIKISAVGRQLGNNSSGMADDVKKHYLVRYSALVASSALSGVGKSYEQTSGSNATIAGNGTVVTNTSDPTNSRIIGNAVGELGNEISQEIGSLTQKPTTYITNNGKIFNVFFNQNVLDNEDTNGMKAN